MTEELHKISVQGLAHIGDAVYELMIRTWLCMTGTTTAKGLHDRAVAFVSAKAQAAAAERILPVLDEDETVILKRGRNTHVNSVPKGSTHEQYHMATGVETLFGYLYISGKTERMNEIFEKIIEGNNGSNHVISRSSERK